MLPDDPRHGESRGFHQHHRDGETACEPCRLANIRDGKQRRWLKQQGRAGYVPLGRQAWVIIDDARSRGLTYEKIAQASKLAASAVWRCHTGGPEYRVRANTRDSLISADLHQLTHVGMARRIRALHRIGYTAPEIAAAAGVCRETPRLALRPGAKSQHATRLAIADVFEKLAMHPQPPSRSNSRARNHATRKNWPPPMAWDPETIDDPRATPARYGRLRDTVSPDSVDWVVVERRLCGQKTRHLTRAEARSVAKLGRERGLTEERVGVAFRRYRDAS